MKLERRFTILTLGLLILTSVLQSLGAATPTARAAEPNPPPAAPTNTQIETFDDLPLGLAPAIAQALTDDLPASFHLQAIKGGYQADNPAHDLTATFGPAGPQMTIGGETWGLILAGLGREGAVQALPTAKLAAGGPRIEYRYSDLTGLDLCEWYLNTAWGLEQGFTIYAPIGGEAGSGDLAIELTMSGSLQARLQDDTTLLLTNAAGQTIARYTGLHAYDANGRQLPAHLSLSPLSISIIVDDSEAVYPLVIDPWVQGARLLASDGTAFDLFGYSVDISGDTVVVGAPYDDDNGDWSGSAYVFVEPRGGWSGALYETAKLLPSDGAAYDQFGRSVAIGGDAGTIVVGAYGDDGNGNWSGSAYVFVEPGGGWSGALSETAKLLPSDGAAYDYFGLSVAIGGDAGAVVVGACNDDDNGLASGSIYVFVEPGSGWSGTLNQSAKLLPSDGAACDIFGCSVAISGDTVVAGALYDDDNGRDSGSAYAFVEPEGGWSGTLNQSAKLLPSDGVEDDYFGWSVAISGDAGTVVIGAYGDDDNGDSSGSAYVFVEPESGWSGALKQSAKLLPSDGAARDEFGHSVAISGDAGAVVVGAYGDDDNGDGSGSAYVFVEPGGGWSGALKQSAKLLPSDGAKCDDFGRSVAIGGDAGAVLVGAPNDDDNGSASGSARIFEDVLLPDLDIAKTVTPTTAAPGETLTYTLTFTAPAWGVHMWDPLPPNVQLVPASLTSTVTPAAVYSPTAHAIIWQGTLPTDSVQVIRFQVTPGVSGTGSLSLPIVNTAWLTDTHSGASVSATVVVNDFRVYLPLVVR